MPALRTLILSVLLTGFVACSRSEGTSDANDMANNQTTDQTADMEVDGNSAIVDMNSGPMSQEDCDGGEWFDDASTSCRMCPGQALSCDAILDSTITIDAEANTVSLTLVDNGPALVTTELFVQEKTAMSFDSTTASMDIREETYDLELGASDPYASTFTMPDDQRIDDEFDKRVFTLERLNISTVCEQTYTLELEGAWDGVRDMIETPASCGM